MIFIILPFIFWIIPFVFAKIFKHSITIKNYLLYFGSAFIPVIASAHLCKALLKTTSRLPYFDYVFSDINGMNTATGIMNKSIILQPNPEYINTIITIGAFLFFVCGIILSIVVVKKINKNLSGYNSNSNWFYLIPLLYGGIFISFTILWRFSL